MALLGIDVGTSNCVMASVGRGSVFCVRNEISEILTPSLVGFGEDERLIGDAAFAQLSSKHSNTCRSMKNMLGRRIDDPDLEFERGYSWNPLVECENKSIGYQVEYRGEMIGISATRVYAALLTELKRIAEKSLGVPISDAVIACPGWYTDRNRSALLAASYIAGLRCSKIISEHAATALGYGISHSKDFVENEPFFAAFVAMGHANTSVSIVQFSQDKLEILAEESDRHLGGRYMDAIIVQKLASIFKAATGIDPMKKSKAVYKLEVQAEKLKKVLSANHEAPFHMECFLGDHDLNGILSRDEFETLCYTHLLQRLNKVMEISLCSSGLTKSQLQCVQIVGGATRTPWVKNAIEKFFEKEISRTLSADECVARGCAFQAAMLSDHYRVREFTAIERLFNPIALSWEGTTKDTADPNGTAQASRSAVVLPYGMKGHQKKKITLNRAGPFSVSASYAEPQNLPPGVDPFLGHCNVNLTPLPDNSAQSMQIFLFLNVHGMFQFHSVSRKIEEEVEQIVKEKRPIAAEGNKDKEEFLDSNDGSLPNNSVNDSQQAPKINGSEVAEEEVEVRKMVKKQRNEPVPFTTSYPHLYTEAQLEQFQELELEMANNDRQNREKQDIMNQFESYIFDMRSKLSGLMARFYQPDTICHYNRALDEALDWLDHNQNMQKSMYSKKMEELTALFDPGFRRQNFLQEVTRGYDRIEELVFEASSLLKGQDANLAPIALDRRQKCITDVQSIEKWLNVSREELQRYPLHVDLPIKTDIIRQNEAFIRDIIASIKKSPEMSVQPDVKSASTNKFSEKVESDRGLEGHSNSPSNSPSNFQNSNVNGAM